MSMKSISHWNPVLYSKTGGGGIQGYIVCLVFRQNIECGYLVLMCTYNQRFEQNV